MDFAVFARLRDWRKEIGQTEAVPVYTMFTNEQLAQMVQTKAQTTWRTSPYQLIQDKAKRFVHGNARGTHTWTASWTGAICNCGCCSNWRGTCSRHFSSIDPISGHGTQSEELILLDSKGDPKPVSNAALADLMRVLKDNVRLVVLNACFSQPQAEAITQVINCAIGMDHEVGDEAALKFAGAFYGSICFGKSIQTAFELGLNSLLLGSISEENTPKLISRTGVDPASIVLISNATSLASAALRERFDYRKRLLPSEFRRYGLLTGDAMLLPPELVRPTWFLRTNNWREGSQSETRIVSNGTSHRG